VDKKVMQDKVFNYLKNKEAKLCVISTASSDLQPSSAVVAYAVKDDLTVVLSTHPVTQKWKNLKENEKVALVFGFDFAGLNIQYHGKSELIERGDSYNDYEELFFGQNPEAKKFMTPDTGFIKITPTWMRVTDYSAQPPEIIEREF